VLKSGVRRTSGNWGWAGPAVRQVDKGTTGSEMKNSLRKQETEEAKKKKVAWTKEPSRYTSKKRGKDQRDTRQIKLTKKNDGKRGKRHKKGLKRRSEEIKSK